MDKVDLVFIVIELWFVIIFLRSAWRILSRPCYSLFSMFLPIFACMIGLFSVTYLHRSKELTLEVFATFKDVFVKSVESKSPTELTLWILLLYFILFIQPKIKKN